MKCGEKITKRWLDRVEKKWNRRKKWGRLNITLEQSESKVERKSENRNLLQTEENKKHRKRKATAELSS